MSSFTYAGKLVVHQTEPSIRSDYSRSSYGSANYSSGSYSSTTNNSSTSSSRRSSPDAYEAYDVREYGAKDHTMTMREGGKVVVVNRHQSGYDKNSPRPTQPSGWATRAARTSSRT